MLLFSNVETISPGMYLRFGEMPEGGFVIYCPWRMIVGEKVSGVGAHRIASHQGIDHFS
jgi:hypothetical protein